MYEESARIIFSFLTLVFDWLRSTTRNKKIRNYHFYEKESKEDHEESFEKVFEEEVNQAPKISARENRSESRGGFLFAREGRFLVESKHEDHYQRNRN